MITPEDINKIKISVKNILNLDSDFKSNFIKCCYFFEKAINNKLTIIPNDATSSVKLLSEKSKTFCGLCLY